ncbi:MAG: hypothetical protein E6G67_10675, partial [Actinobacteria bacterium]
MTKRPSTNPKSPPAGYRDRAVLAVALVLVGVVAVATLSPEAGARNAPTTPTNLHMTAVTATSISLTWDASSDNRFVAGYDVYQDGVKVGTETLLGHTFIGLRCGASYNLGVAARDDKDTTSLIATLLAATSPCFDAQAPTAPSGIVQVAKTATSATLSWSPSTDNVGVVGYGAYQGGIRIAQTSLTSYTFSSLSCGATTAVGLDAYDATGNR